MSPIVREYYRVPREDRAVYIRPPASELPALIERNRRLLASWDFEFAGRPFQEFRAAARAEIIALARSYAERWGFAIEKDWSEPMPVIATGHQPTPFHPGVWIKNFLAGSLAAAAGGVALNLAVDSDEGTWHVLRFPTGTPGQAGAEVRVAEVKLAAAGGVAFEEQPASGLPPQAAEEVLAALPAGPLRDAFRRWRLLGEAVRGAGSLGEVQVVARRSLEQSLGLRNLELPVSALADSGAFRLLLAELLRRHEELFAAYNGALAEYRRVYRERSAAQPVPDLARRGPRVELPFWVWRPGEPRRRLWVEPASGGRAPSGETRAPQAGRLNRLTLLAEGEAIGALSEGDIADARRAAARLAEFRKAGWKIRPRALALTLFVRMALGDVFIHGLGGALYDKITDGVFERLLGVRAPEMILASCTVRLPIGSYPSTPKDLEAARRLVRDWRFNADRLLAAATRARPEAAGLIDEKRRLIGHREPTREGRSRAWRRIRQINEALAVLEPDGPRAAAERLARVERELKWNAILQNREYPFCLYPPEELALFYREVTRV